MLSNSDQHNNYRTALSRAHTFAKSRFIVIKNAGYNTPSIARVGLGNRNTFLPGVTWNVNRKPNRIPLP